MKRLTRGSQVLYVERHRGWSLIYFLGSLIALAIAAAAFEKRDASATAFMAAVSAALALYATGRLLTSRMLVVDPDRDLLIEITRSPLGRKLERSASLRGLSLLVDGRLVVVHRRRVGEARMVQQDIWIVHQSGERWLFDRGFLAPAGGNAALRLAEELGCEIVTKERQVW